jgi:hypothetical protein
MTVACTPSGAAIGGNEAGDEASTEDCGPAVDVSGLGGDVDMDVVGAGVDAHPAAASTNPPMNVNPSHEVRPRIDSSIASRAAWSVVARRDTRVRLDPVPSMLRHMAASDELASLLDDLQQMTREQQASALPDMVPRILAATKTLGERD